MPPAMPALRQSTLRFAEMIVCCAWAYVAKDKSMKQNASDLFFVIVIPETPCSRQTLPLRRGAPKGFSRVISHGFEQKTCRGPLLSRCRILSD
jgi:hypothetical protein